MPIATYNVQPGNVSETTEVSNNVTGSSLIFINHVFLVNFIRQLASLSEHSASILDGLFQILCDLNKRTTSLQNKTSKLAQHLQQNESFSDDNADQKQVTANLDSTNIFKSNLLIDQQVVDRHTMPNSLFMQYNFKCETHPTIPQYDYLREDGKNGIKFYSDPNYFFDMWSKQMLDNIKPKRQHRNRRTKQKAERKAIKPMIAKDYGALAKGKEFADMPVVNKNGLNNENQNKEIVQQKPSFNKDLSKARESVATGTFGNQKQQINLKSTPEVNVQNQKGKHEEEEESISNFVMPILPVTVLSSRESAFLLPLPLPPTLPDGSTETTVKYSAPQEEDNFQQNQNSTIPQVPLAPPIADLTVPVTSKITKDSDNYLVTEKAKNVLVLTDNRSNLLSSIRAGIQLKKVQAASTESKATKSSGSGVKDVQAVFEEAMRRLRKKLVDSDEDSEDEAAVDEDDNWNNDNN